MFLYLSSVPFPVAVPRLRLTVYLRFSVIMEYLVPATNPDVTCASAGPLVLHSGRSSGLVVVFVGIYPLFISGASSWQQQCSIDLVPAPAPRLRYHRAAAPARAP